MKQVFNWTIGSFFRTIGRIAAFLIVGCFIAYLLAHSNIDWGIKDLFLVKVNASSYDVKWINGAQWKILGGNYATAPVDGGAFYSFTDSLSNNSKTYIIKFNNGPIVTSSNSKEYLFNVKLIMALPNGASLYNNQYTCTISSSLDVTNGAITDYSVGYPTSEYEDIEYWYKSFTCNAHYGSIEMEEVKFAITMFYWVDNNESAHQPCYAQSNAGQNYSFVCPVSIGLPNINGVVVKIWSNATTNFTFGLNDLFNINLDSNQEIINNQQQQTQIMQDTNTTSDSANASNYVNNYQDDTPTGLTAAVTAPLNIMNNLVLGNSSPLCFTLNSKQTCFPDGSLVWGNNHTQGKWFKSGLSDPKGAFVILFNLVVGGFLCYKMLISMLRIWNNMLDPTNTKIEVMKL